MPAPPTGHILISANCEWPGFSRSRPFGPRADGIADAVRASGAGLATFQELGQAEAAKLAGELDRDWWYWREGLNCVFWRDSIWRQDGDTIGIGIPSYGQMRRTLLAVPLEHRQTGEKVTVGSSHWANRSEAAQRELDRSPSEAQIGQAKAVHNAMGDRRRVIIGIDSNSPTSSYGGRGWLNRNGWRTKANGVDIIAVRPGCVVTKQRTVSIPSDHPKALVVTFTTNTGATTDA